MLRIDGGPSGRGWSYYSAFLRCPRLWLFNRAQGSPENLPRLRGSIVHAGLAHLYVGRHLEDGYKPIRVPDGDKDGELTLVSKPSDILSPREAMAARARQQPDAGLAAKALADALDDYETIRRVVLMTPPPRVLMCERLVETDLGGVKLTARIDLAIVEADRAIIVDHKRLAPGTKNPGIAYGNDGQYISMHLHGRRLWGDKFGGVRLHAVNNVDARMIEIPATEGQIRRLREQIIRAHHAIEALEGTRPADYPRTMETLTCTHRYGTCDAYSVCVSE